MKTLQEQYDMKLAEAADVNYAIATDIVRMFIGDSNISIKSLSKNIKNLGMKVAIDGKEYNETYTKYVDQFTKLIKKLQSDVEI